MLYELFNIHIVLMIFDMVLFKIIVMYIGVFIM